MERKTIVMIALGLAFIGALYVADFEDENHKYENDLQGRIKAGKQFCSLLFEGDKHELLSRFKFCPYAKSKLQNANLQPIAPMSVREKYVDNNGKYWSLFEPVLFSHGEELDLAALEKHERDIGMAFSFNHKFDISPTILGNNRMLYSVVFRYVEPGHDTFWGRIFGKIANAVPFCSSFGTTGMWLVVDYSYTYNLSDFGTWCLKEGDSFVSQRRKEDKIFWEKLKTEEGAKSFRRKLRQELEISDLWASSWVEGNPERIDLYQEIQSLRNRFVW